MSDLHAPSSAESDVRNSGTLAAPATGPDRRRSRILIVDDDAPVREALADVLIAEGYAVTPAAGGFQALALAAGTPVDLVLLDLNLLGQSGWDTFTEFSAAHPDAPVIIITAKPGQQDEAARVRADALMEKPLDLPLLLETIAALLAEPKTDRRRRLDQPGFQTLLLKAVVPEGDGEDHPHGAAPAPEARHTNPAGGPCPPPPVKRILVVDDDASVRELLGRILADEGYTVGMAGDGGEALAVAARGSFDLVMLDLNLPTKSGWDTLERLTRRDPGVPVIIITGRRHQVLTALAAGVGALMEKPLDFPKLLRTVRLLLGEGPEPRHAHWAGAQ